MLSALYAVRPPVQLSTATMPAPPQDGVAGMISDAMTQSTYRGCNRPASGWRWKRNRVAKRKVARVVPPRTTNDILTERLESGITAEPFLAGILQSVDLLNQRNLLPLVELELPVQAHA